MTDFATHSLPTQDRSISLLRPSVPMRAILRALVRPLVLCGPALAHALTAYGRAKGQAYVGPFSRPPQAPRVVQTEEDLEGRDPNW